MAETLTARLVGGTGGTITKVVDIVMPVSAWHGGEGKWAQIVEVAEVSPFSKIDLQPNDEQIEMLYSTALTTENADGIVTVYASGDKPTGDITMQAVLTEVVRVTAGGQGSKIYGNTVGTTTPRNTLIYPKSL